MDTQKRNSTIAGAILILLGLVFFITQFTGGLAEGLVVLAVGGAFLAGYLATRAYGLLIPACILIGLGLGQLANLIPFHIFDTSAIGLGLGFLAIYFVDMRVRGHTHWWPLVPGGILLVSGLLSGLAEIVRFLLPIIVLVVGALLLANALGWRGWQNWRGWGRRY